jgi:ribokinase
LAVEKIMDVPGTMLLQLEIPLPVVQASLELGKRKRFTTVLNPAPACQLTDEILKQVDIITPNETETQILTGIFPENKNNIAKAAEILLGKVNHAVIITLGNKGVFYATKSGEHAYIPSIRVSAVDTTAAGDVFNGYLVAALNKGKNLAEACSIANKAASISVTRFGAQPSIPFVNELF